MNGKIIKIISNNYTVFGDDKNIYECMARGKFRNDNIKPLVGDYVKIDTKSNIIVEIYERRNSLVRPPVSNIDQLFIITSVKYPDLDTYLLDKLITLSEFNQIVPIICFTKLDLLEDNEIENIHDVINYYNSVGYKVLLNTDIKSIKKEFKDKITVFTGQTGAGKSTLLNRIDKKLNIKTGEISTALGRGKHTTRHSELIEVESGWVADTPGFSALEFTDMKLSDIRDNFADFEIYKDKCKYKDCMHLKEDSCKIKEEVLNGNILKSRYENYLKFVTKR